MINSRNLADLHPHVRKLAERLLARAKEDGIDLLVTSTYRDHESQAALYAQGRTAPGKRVTNAKPGYSWHNWRVAFDVVPIISGKAVWEDEALWRRVGALGQSVGLEWGGAWASFPDKPHFQYTGGLTLADFRSGKTLEVA